MEGRLRASDRSLLSTFVRANIKTKQGVVLLAIVCSTVYATSAITLTAHTAPPAPIKDASNTPRWKRWLPGGKRNTPKKQRVTPNPSHGESTSVYYGSALLLVVTIIFGIARRLLAGFSLGLVRAYLSGDIVRMLWYNHAKAEGFSLINSGDLAGKWFLSDGSWVKELRRLGDKVVRISADADGADKVSQHMILGAGGGDEHSRMREAMEPFFRRRLYEPLLPELEAIASERLRAKHGQPAFDLEAYFVALTVELRVLVLFGIRSEVASGEVPLKWHQLGAAIMHYLDKPAHRHALNVNSHEYRELTAVVTEIIATTDQPLEGCALGFMRELVRSGKLSGTEMVSNLALFLVALAPAAVLTWATCHIAKHHRTVEPRARASHPYLRQCLLETLRLTPGVPTLPRRIVPTRPPHDGGLHLNGTSLRPGSELFAFQTFVHVKASNWADPFKFDPSRWDGVVSSHPNDSHRQVLACPAAMSGIFFPFGFGRHRCMGMELALDEMTIVLRALYADSTVAVQGSNPASNVEDNRWRQHVYGFPDRRVRALFKPDDSLDHWASLRSMVSLKAVASPRPGAAQTPRW